MLIRLGSMEFDLRTDTREKEGDIHAAQQSAWFWGLRRQRGFIGRITRDVAGFDTSSDRCRVEDNDPHFWNSGTGIAS